MHPCVFVLFISVREIPYLCCTVDYFHIGFGQNEVAYRLADICDSLPLCILLITCLFINYVDFLLGSYFKRHSRNYNVLLCFSCGVIQVSVSLCSHHVFSPNVSFILLGVVFRCAQDQQKPVKVTLTTESQCVAIFLTQEFSCC